MQSIYQIEQIRLALTHLEEDDDDLRRELLNDLEELTSQNPQWVECI